jgi:hypothetical protein
LSAKIAKLDGWPCFLVRHKVMSSEASRVTPLVEVSEQQFLSVIAAEVLISCPRTTLPRPVHEKRGHQVDRSPELAASDGPLRSLVSFSPSNILRGFDFLPRVAQLEVGDDPQPY